jgi:hypothetical protein
MPAKTLAAFLVGALAASTGTATALTKGHVFRLQEGDEASYGKVTCEARYVAQYSGFSCFGAERRYSIIYAPGEIRVLRFNGKTTAATTVFHLGTSGG